MQKIVFDFETDGLDTLNPKLVLICYKLDDGPIVATKDINDIKKYLESPDWVKVCHNAKFEISVSKSLGINIVGPYYDTQVAVWLLNEGIPRVETNGEIEYDHRLKPLCSYILNIPGLRTWDQFAKGYPIKEYTEEVYKSNNNKKGYKKGDKKWKTRSSLASEIPPRDLEEYCKQDVDLTGQLWDYCKLILTEYKMIALFQMECGLIPILESMEREGTMVDVPYLTKYKKTLEDELVVVEGELEQIAGCAVNLASPKQIGVLLYDTLKFPIIKRNKPTAKQKEKGIIGQPSTDVKTLEKLAEQNGHPIFTVISKHKGISKILGTYVNCWLNKADKNGRVHFYMKQTTTVSGRFTSDSGQIPKKTTNAKIIRRGIISRPGYTFIQADYEQIEPRISAHVSGDKELIRVFKDGIDIYRATVSAVLNKILADVTDEDRDLGKIIVLANNYGMTKYGLAKKLNIEVDEAGKYIENYFNHYSGVKVWRLETIGKARKRGYTETILGRRSIMSEDLKLPVKHEIRYGRWQDVNKWDRDAAEREASNRPIQGSSQDIIKTAMIRLFKQLSTESRMLLMTHDDLLFEIPDYRVKASVPVIREIMETAIKLRVAIPVEIKTGKNLANMTEVK